MLRRVRSTIESHVGWTICGTAVNGREAVTKAAKLRPDLVILDFAMPNLNGLEAAEQIHRVMPELPIVMFTMYGRHVKREADDHGINRLVDKAESGALVDAVEELLGTTAEQNPELPRAASAS